MARRIDWNERGMKLEQEGRAGEAEAAYLRAIEAHPRGPRAWFNLGLLYKRARRWEDSRRCNLRATSLDPQNDGAFWNLGIAATALGDWASARTAWRRFGVPIPEGTGPFELPLGQVPIRLHPQGDPEVVWCRRIDPARAIIENVPLPASGRRYGDLLLHDGAPNGYREVDGVKVPVFDELELLQASTYTTFRVRIETRGPFDVDALQELLEARGMSVEDWTSNLRRLCKACSEGTPHEHQRGKESALDATGRDLGVAAVDEAEAASALDTWEAAAPGRSHSKLVVALAGGQRH